MQRLTTRSIKTATAIKNREDFVTSGALSAENVQGLTSWNSGYLSGPDLDKFLDHSGDITYVVWSYSTPIAWYSNTYGWHKVTQRFSMTTTKHQGNLYLID